MVYHAATVIQSSAFDGVFTMHLVMNLRTTAMKDMDSPAINEAILLATLLSSRCSGW